MSQFEAESARLKPLLGRAFIGFAGQKSVQHGAVEHLHPILEAKIACNAYAYWLFALLDMLFSGDFSLA